MHPNSMPEPLQLARFRREEAAALLRAPCECPNFSEADRVWLGKHVLESNSLESNF